MNKTKKYLFVHIAYQGGVDFISDLISFFCEDYDDSNLRKNLWITRNHDIYEKHKDEADVVYSEISEVGMINKYGGMGHYIIIHGLHSSGFSLLFIKKNLLKHIIWRTWGHDINLPHPNKKSILKTIYRYSSFFFYYLITRRFALIGTANIVDDLKVVDVYGHKIKTINLPYGKPECERNRIITMLLGAKSYSDGVIRIMVGHSGFPIDNHIEIIDRVSRFINNNTIFYIMLPYGNKDYIEKVEKYADKKLGSSCKIIKKRMPYCDYLSFIKSMDIAILGMQNSSALGNVAILLYYEKKIYLNPDGDIAKAFSQMNIPFGNVNSIKNEDYSDFIKSYKYDEQKLLPITSYLSDVSYCKKQWDDLLCILKQKN